jgi:cell wall-associated NlpC family hydrolase
VARHAPRFPLAVVSAVLVALGVVLASGTAAHAEPSVADIEKQIDDAWAKLEPTIERHNATAQDLAAKKKQAAVLGAKIAPLELQLDLAMERVTQLVVQDYKSGETSEINAVLSSGSPAVLTERLGLLDHFARQEAQSLRKVSDLLEKYAAQKGPLDALVAQLTVTEKDLAAKTKEIDTEIAKLQALRLKAYGSTTSMGSLRPAPCPATYPGGKAGIAVKFACAQIGKPYVWGADGPGSYDCSGLTMAAWAQAGVSLPHNAYKQRQVVRSISRSQLQPGDLVFYYSDVHHVGMYVGNGWLVHASRPGVPVQMKRYDDGNIHSFGRPG